MLPIETLEKDINRIPNTPSFEVSAWQGKNVLATLKKIIVTTVASIKKDFDSAKIRQNHRLNSDEKTANSFPQDYLY